MTSDSDQSQENERDAGLQSVEKKNRKPVEGEELLAALCLILVFFHQLVAHEEACSNPQ